MTPDSCLDPQRRQLLLDILQKRKLTLENSLIRDYHTPAERDYIGDELDGIEVLKIWVENVDPC